MHLQRTSMLRSNVPRVSCHRKLKSQSAARHATFSRPTMSRCMLGLSVHCSKVHVGRYCAANWCTVDSQAGLPCIDLPCRKALSQFTPAQHLAHCPYNCFPVLCVEHTLLVHRVLLHEVLNLAYIHHDLMCLRIHKIQKG